MTKVSAETGSNRSESPRLHSLDSSFLGTEEPSRAGAIRFNRNVIFLSPEAGTNHESELKEVLWRVISLSKSLVDFGLCSVLRSRAKSGELQGWSRNLRSIQVKPVGSDGSGCRYPSAKCCELPERLRFL